MVITDMVNFLFERIKSFTHNEHTKMVNLKVINADVEKPLP